MAKKAINLPPSKSGYENIRQLIRAEVIRQLNSRDIKTVRKGKKTVKEMGDWLNLFGS